MIKQKYRQHKETIHDFFWRTLQILGKQGVIFLIFFISAKFLSLEDFGLLNYLIAIVALFMIFCDFGFSASVSKFTVEYSVNKDKNIQKIFFSIFFVVFLIVAIIGAILFFYGEYFFGENIFFVLLLLPTVLFMPLISLLDGIYRGEKRFKIMSVIYNVVGIFSIFLSYFLIKQYFLLGAIISQNIFSILLFLFLFIFIKNQKFKFDKNVLKKILPYALIVGLGEIGFFLYSNVDILMLKKFGYTIEIGHYSIANKIFAIIILPFSILGQVIAPNITKLVHEGKMNDVKKRYIKHIIIFFVIGIILSALLYFLYPFILNLFLKKYLSSESIQIFNWLLFLLPSFILARFLSQAYLISSGNAKLNLVMIPIGILNVVLNYIFISIFGFIGVVYSTVVCTTLNRLIIFIFLYKKFS